MGTATVDHRVSKDRLLDRLARIEGQVRGITRMVDGDRHCIDVLTQISAVHAALDKVALGLLDRHVRLRPTTLPGRCGKRDDQADEVMAAVGRLISR
jgi:CsoR family transcriptional regulator, copper-sensing transcriptional repressor